MLFEPTPAPTDFSPYVDAGSKSMFLSAVYDDISRCPSTPSTAKGGEPESWIDWFCGLKGHEMFCRVDRCYIEDDFNLYGLKREAGIASISKCLDLILDRVGNHVPVDAKLIQDACTLYGLIHARYLLTEFGLDEMYKKFLFEEYGHCPSRQCQRQATLPIGLSDEVGVDSLRIFCPKCQCIYPPPPMGLVDGASFGTTAAHLFLMTYPRLKPKEEVIIESAYVPRVFGFRIHNKEVAVTESKQKQKLELSVTTQHLENTGIRDISNNFHLNTRTPLIDDDDQSSPMIEKPSQNSAGSKSPTSIADYKSPITLPLLTPRNQPLTNTYEETKADEIDGLDDKYLMLRNLWADDTDSFLEELEESSGYSYDLSPSNSSHDIVKSNSWAEYFSTGNTLNPNPKGAKVTQYNPIDLHSDSGPLASKGSFKYSTLDDIMLSDTNPLNGYSFLDPLYQYPSFTIYEGEELETSSDDEDGSSKRNNDKKEDTDKDEMDFDAELPHSTSLKENEIQEQGPLENEIQQLKKSVIPSQRLSQSLVEDDDDDNKNDEHKEAFGEQDLNQATNDYIQYKRPVPYNSNNRNVSNGTSTDIDSAMFAESETSRPMLDGASSEDEPISSHRHGTKPLSSNYSENDHNDDSHTNGGISQTLSQSSWKCTPSIVELLKKRDEMKLKFEMQLAKVKACRVTPTPNFSNNMIVDEVIINSHNDDISDISDPWA